MIHSSPSSLVKIKFKQNSPNIKPNELCTFIHNSNQNDYFKAKFIDNSRIDALPLFDIITNHNHPISEYKLNYKSLEFTIDKVELIKTFEDNSKYFKTDFNENIDDLIKIAQTVFNISNEDMEDRKKFLAKMRDVKLNQILK
jgi:hypothetical protein